MASGSGMGPQGNLQIFLFKNQKITIFNKEDLFY